MVQAYLAAVPWQRGTRVLEIGCGTGFICRTLAAREHVAEVVGIDPSPVFVERARALARGLANVSFDTADGRELPHAGAAFDGVVLNTTMSHVPQPELLIREAHRVLRAGGWLAIFDGDYATATVARHPADPLQACVQAFLAGFVHDPWVMRRLPQLVAAQGFAGAPMQSHGYTEAPQAGYMLTWIERGADALVAAGCIDARAGDAIKLEGRRRSDTRSWFGHIAFASLVTVKAAHSTS
jgi:SAM-dependent methyltransferase